MKHIRKTALACIIAVLAGVMPSDCMVATATTTAQQIQQAEQEKNDLQNQLDKTQENLEGLKGAHNTLQGELKNLNTQMTQVSDSLTSLEQQI